MRSSHSVPRSASIVAFYGSAETAAFAEAVTGVQADLIARLGAAYLPRVVASTALAVLVLAACGSPSGPGGGAASVAAGPGAATSSAAAGPSLAVGQKAWVDVSVATLWRTPSAPRRVDAPALARPARSREWLSAMTTEQRRGLNGRADTQVLYGDRVVVLRLRKAWARIRTDSR